MNDRSEDEPTAPDVSGERLLAFAESIDAEVVGRELIRDDRELIAERLTHWSGPGGANLILTTGGTGFATSDVTPEATRDVIERSAPGIAEAIRIAASRHTDNWPLSRAVAGIRGRCLIINLPGSPRSIDQSAPVLEPFLKHAVSLIEGEESSH
ncbi:MAG: MogA/MoaB family molybdenum cofactor biosynthesis protein [Solirubrobacterales bacterium]|nr:MogA/MoaB family molybdenum cofactor biosynthesis protein [Solirubrobacterales bacterium]